LKRHQCGHLGKSRWCHRCEQAKTAEARVAPLRAARAQLPEADPVVREKLEAVRARLDQLRASAKVA
jgi:hypothetical protein